MPHTQETIDRMASEIFELYQLVAILRSRQPTGPDDLSETEYVALDALVREEPLTIGEIQKRVGVVPAQMSRIIRALEEQGGRGYVECKINPRDRRRIDVYMTDAGRQAHERFRAARLGTMYDTLRALSPEDRVHFMRIIRQLREAFQSRFISDEK